MKDFKARYWDGFNAVFEYSNRGLASFFGHYEKALAGGNGPVLELWTGLKDKDGKEIYEGDLIQSAHGRICEVTWHEYGGAWDASVRKVSGEGGHLGFLTREWPSCVEVIGNIHEPPTPD